MVTRQQEKYGWEFIFEATFRSVVLGPDERLSTDEVQRIYRGNAPPPFRPGLSGSSNQRYH